MDLILAEVDFAAIGTFVIAACIALIGIQLAWTGYFAGKRVTKQAAK